MKLVLAVIILMCSTVVRANCTDSLVENIKNNTNENLSYILTSQNNSPKFILILMPGGDGNLDPRRIDGTLKFNLPGNFLIRSRNIFCDSNFAAVSTNASKDPDRVKGLIDHIRNTFPRSKICLIGTSKGTLATMALAKSLDGTLDCIIHTASIFTIGFFDTRSFKTRHLIVHNKDDECIITLYGSALSNHEKYSTPLITMTGGLTQGDKCQARSYHGFYGIEQETIKAIKEWILQG